METLFDLVDQQQTSKPEPKNTVEVQVAWRESEYGEKPVKGNLYWDGHKVSYIKSVPDSPHYVLYYHGALGNPSLMLGSMRLEVR